MELHAIKSYYDNRLGGLVTLEDDVLSIVSQVRQLYGTKITIELDPDQGAYHFVEHCEDHTDRLIFTVDTLDGRCIDRLLIADAHGRGYHDPYDLAEREQDRLHDEADARSAEKIREQGERLIHALKKDGIEDHLPIQVAIPKGVRF